MVGAGEREEALGATKLACRDLGHEQAACGLDALGERDDPRARRQARGQLVADVPKVRGGHGEHDKFGATGCRLKARGRDHVRRKLVVCEVGGVGAGLANALRKLCPAAPEPHLVGLRRNEPGEGRAPGAGPYDGDVAHLAAFSSSGVAGSPFLWKLKAFSVPFASLTMLERCAHTTMSPASSTTASSARLGP